MIMKQFSYRGRDKEGRLKIGERVSESAEELGASLIKEGITPVSIEPLRTGNTFWENLSDRLLGEQAKLEELSIFARQMQLLHKAGVPIVASLHQLAANTRSRQLSIALDGVADNLQKGSSMASAMRLYPNTFSPLIVNIVDIGETTGHLSESFGYLYEYLEFESSSIKQIKTAFRYPTFVVISILAAIAILNIFVVPTFAKFYSGLDVALPWQTRFIINFSNIVVHYGYLILIGLVLLFVWIYRYIHTPTGKYKWDTLQLNIPVFGKLLKRIIVIRFCQSLGIVLKSGIAVNQGLALVSNTITNAYINRQILDMQTAIERGVSFTNAIGKMDIFTPLEVQILAVGEKNGELSPALDFISNFHNHEIQYDLKRLSDMIGPIMLAAVAGLVLIIALGVYLPIWNMVNLKH